VRVRGEQASYESLLPSALGVDMRTISLSTLSLLSGLGERVRGKRRAK
jgi:hypothetical protein